MMYPYKICRICLEQWRSYTVREGDGFPGVDWALVFLPLCSKNDAFLPEMPPPSVPSINPITKKKGSQLLFHLHLLHSC